MLVRSFKLSSLWKLARIPSPFANQLRMCLGSSALQNSPSSESDAGCVDESEGSLAHQTHERIELLVDHLKCSTSSATSILMRNKKLLDIKQETLVKNMGILKALFPLKDILKHPEILSFQFGTAEQRYHNLEEMGVKTVTPGKVVGFQDIVTKPAYVLKRHRLIPTETDPAVHMLSFLDCPQSVQAEILSRLPLHYTLTMSMKAVKQEVVRSYLSWRLKCSRKEVAALIAKYPSIENRSLQFLRRTIEIVTNNFNFTCKKIVSNGFVLLAHPNNLENLLCQVRHLAGMDVRQLGNLCPRLLTVPSENVVRVERLLHQYGISQAQAARCIGIYALSPATIAARLQELDKAQHNTRLLRVYSAIDERVRVLGYTLKHFAKTCDIGDASRGSLSSYAYILLVLYYLQQCQPPVIPVLQELYPEGDKKPEVIIEGCNAWFFDDIERLQSVWSEFGQNTESVGELWLGLLRFYTEVFDFRADVVCIRQREPITRLQKSWTSRCIAIEDPFKLDHNLGSGVSRKMNASIMNALIDGRALFGTPFRKPPTAYDSYICYFFGRRQLVDGQPPNDRGCWLCSKIGHRAKDCPRHPRCQ